MFTDSGSREPLRGPNKCKHVAPFAIPSVYLPFYGSPKPKTVDSTTESVFFPSKYTCKQCVRDRRFVDGCRVPRKPSPLNNGVDAKIRIANVMETKNSVRR